MHASKGITKLIVGKRRVEYVRISWITLGSKKHFKISSKRNFFYISFPFSVLLTPSSRRWSASSSPVSSCSWSTSTSTPSPATTCRASRSTPSRSSDSESSSCSNNSSSSSIRTAAPTETTTTVVTGGPPPTATGWSRWTQPFKRR